MSENNKVTFQKLADQFDQMGVEAKLVMIQEHLQGNFSITIATRDDVVKKIMDEAQKAQPSQDNPSGSLDTIPTVNGFPAT